MSALPSPGTSGSLVALALSGMLLVLLLWLGWRRPTWVLLLALASLAIRPQLLWSGPAVGYEWGLQHTLLVFALAMSALRYRIYRTANWPVLALLATFCLSVAFGNLHPELSAGSMMTSLAVLALPFTFAQVVLEPGSRRACAMVIMLTPLLSVSTGAVLQALDVQPLMFFNSQTAEYRLQGAAGIAAVFGMLAFAAFAVALHEATQPGGRYAGYLAALNLVLVVLSGTRMAMFASGTLLVAYAMAAPRLRERLWRYRGRALLGAAIVMIAVVAYLPGLELRLFADDAGTIRLSGRDVLWSFYLQELWQSPWFGRGVGAGFVAGDQVLNFILNTPHNEYLHLLVNGGIVGFALIAGGIVRWYRDLLAMSSPNDRTLLLTLIPALLLYASTDNLLTYPTGLGLFAYFGVVLTRPSPHPFPPDQAAAFGRASKAPADALRELDRYRSSHGFAECVP